MMEHETYWWLIYLAFLAIPLARIIPRILSRRRAGAARHEGLRRSDYGDGGRGNSSSGHAHVTRDDMTGARTRPGKSPRTGIATDDAAASGDRGRPAGTTGGKTGEMAVMGSIHRGAKTFESIQKKTGMDISVLERTLEHLETQGMITVVHKQGLFGVRVEIHPTGKGFGEP